MLKKSIDRSTNEDDVICSKCRSAYKESLFFTYYAILVWGLSGQYIKVYVFWTDHVIFTCSRVNNDKIIIPSFSIMWISYRAAPIIYFLSFILHRNIFPIHHTYIYSLVSYLFIKQDPVFQSVFSTDGTFVVLWHLKMIICNNVKTLTAVI
jgi:hypothetical protein